MRDAWRNDTFFARLRARTLKTAYGLGPAGHDIVNTDSREQVMPDDPYGSVTAPMPQSNPVTFPAGADYDTDDNLILEHNQRLPLHDNASVHEEPEGFVAEVVAEVGAEKDAEVGNNLSMLTEQREDAPLSQARMWTDSYTSPNQFEDQDNIHLGLSLRANEWKDDKPWVCVDLDGTILEDVPTAVPNRGSTEEMIPLGAPLPGAADALQELVSLGWRVSIYSARFGDAALAPETIEAWAAQIAEHLKRHEIAFSDVWAGRKPRATAFVDNKAIRFDGDWAAVLQDLVVLSSSRAPESEEDNLEVGEIELEGAGGPLDYVEDPNDFGDPLYSRQNRGVDRPPELEGALYG